MIICVPHHASARELARKHTLNSAGKQYHVHDVCTMCVCMHVCSSMVQPVHASCTAMQRIM